PATPCFPYWTLFRSRVCVFVGSVLLRRGGDRRPLSGLSSARFSAHPWSCPEPYPPRVLVPVGPGSQSPTVAPRAVSGHDGEHGVRDDVVPTYPAAPADSTDLFQRRPEGGYSVLFCGVCGCLPSREGFWVSGVSVGVMCPWSCARCLWS